MTQTDPPQTVPQSSTAPTQSGTAATGASPEAAASTSVRIIKRYSNRKLYDTVESRYVTLPQIAELVRKGEDVRIIDNNTKEDLTSVTLAQILYEEERKQSRALPLAALKDLIHTSGEKLITSLREGPMGKLIGTKGEGGTEVRAPEQPAAVTAMPDGKDAGSPGRLYEFYEQSRGSLQEWQHRVDERVRKVVESLTPTNQFEKLQSEVRRLAQRLEEIETKLVARGTIRKDSDESK